MTIEKKRPLQTLDIKLWLINDGKISRQAPGDPPPADPNDPDYPIEFDSDEAKHYWLIKDTDFDKITDMMRECSK